MTGSAMLASILLVLLLQAGSGEGSPAGGLVIETASGHEEELATAKTVEELIEKYDLSA